MTKRIFITGAGFTRAFYKDAPLIIGDYDSESLLKDFERMPTARHVLETEIARNPGGLINLERFMTRLASGMPHDRSEKDRDELRLLLSSIKSVFLRKVQDAMAYKEEEPLLRELASYCIERKVNCITFNYDDTLDKALHKCDPQLFAKGGIHDVKGWGPTYGYGFPCWYSSDSSYTHSDHHRTVLLLKLHGSMNWFPRYGSQPPYALSSIFHKESWFTTNMISPSDITPFGRTYGDVAFDSEPTEATPFIVPPVLSKSSLAIEPVLRFVWTTAFDLLATAEEVTFLGYSMPLTDFASEFLFTEALLHLPPDRISVVNWTPNGKPDSALIERYQGVFPRIRPDQFRFDGAKNWASELIRQENAGATPTPTVRK